MTVKVDPRAPISPRYQSMARIGRPATLVSRTPHGDAYVAFAVTPHRWSKPVLVPAEYVRTT